MSGYRGCASLEIMGLDVVQNDCTKCLLPNWYSVEELKVREKGKGTPSQYCLPSVLCEIKSPAGHCCGIFKIVYLRHHDNVCMSHSHTANCCADALCMENFPMKKKNTNHSQDDGYIWHKSTVGTNVSSTEYRCQCKFSSLTSNFLLFKNTSCSQEHSIPEFSAQSLDRMSTIHIFFPLGFNIS